MASYDVVDRHDVFVSYSRNDFQAAANLRIQLAKHGLSVFKDDESIRQGELWLSRLQDEVDACGAFVVLVGRDGVRRWIGAETQAALGRYFGPHNDAHRLPIFPILLGETEPDTLPAFLRLFQAIRWNGDDSLPRRLLDQIRKRTIVADEAIRFEGCPFVGLAAYEIDQAQLFFGRQKETLDALACFFDIRPGRPRVRWLEISGNSGSGKSSLMQAGLLPLIDEGWLWRPRSEYEDWKRIGPIMPGEYPVEMLAEGLAQAFKARMGEIVEELKRDDNALRFWLREKKSKGTAFLLAIDQFEELFTFVDREERHQFDRLLAAALDDADCPLFVISTVRTDFLDRVENLPRLMAVRNRVLPTLDDSTHRNRRPPRRCHVGL
jgi:TIR domain